MNIQRILISSILPLTVILTGCSDNSDNSMVPDSSQTASARQIAAEQKAAADKKSFLKFYQDFSNALESRDWPALAALTTFPLVLRSELDGEPEVILDKPNFINKIGEIFNEEVYISINDELLASNYRDIILNLHQHHVMNDEAVQLFGLRFEKDPDSWKFTGITTHVHIVEKYVEGK